MNCLQINLDKDNEEKFQKKLEEKLESMRKEFEKKEEELNAKFNENILKERKNLLAKQKMEIENLRKQHQKEVDVRRKSNLQIEIFAFSSS